MIERWAENAETIDPGARNDVAEQSVDSPSTQRVRPGPKGDLPAEARVLMAHGIQPVLVRPNTKKPPRSYDQDTVTCEANFKRLIDDGEGKVTKQWLGSRLGSGDNVDVDCDWPKAIAMLALMTSMGLLPETAALGKPSDPRPTHYMYACADAPNRQFTLPELDDPRFQKSEHKFCILELRSN